MTSGTSRIKRRCSNASIDPLRASCSRNTCGNCSNTDNGANLERTIMRASHKFTMWDAVSEEARFWIKVHAEDGVACWRWLAAKSHDGYGRFRTSDRRTIIAHRMAYEMCVGPIPEKMTLDHLCRNRLCMNPAHMEVVTRGENTSRGWAYRRMS